MRERSGEAVAAVDGGLEGATLVQEVTLRGRSEPTALWAVEVDAEATSTGTWRAAEDEAGASQTLGPGAEEPVEDPLAISSDFVPPF